MTDTSELTRYGPHYTGNGQRYLVRLPGTDKAKGKTRSTAFAKTIDDEATLAPWKVTNAVVGVLTDTPTRVEWQALLAEHPNPWYAGDEAKQRARDLIEQAQKAGGGDDRRDIGTGLHTILHLVASGRVQPDVVDNEWRAHVVNALATLEAAGLRIVPDLCELSVLNRTYDTVGRFDVMLEATDDRYGQTGTLHIGDWKTGGSTWRPKKDYRTKRQTGWLDGYDLADGAHAGQLALYAGASDIVVWPENPWDECRLVEMPDVDQTRGFIIHLPSNEPGNVSIRVLDLTVGRTWLDACRLVRDTRKLRPLLDRFGAVMPPLPEIVPAASQSSSTGDVVSASVAAAVTATVALTSADPGEEVTPPAQPAEWERAAGSLKGVGDRRPAEATVAAIRGLAVPSDKRPADAFDGLTDGYVDPPADPRRREWVINRLRALTGYRDAIPLIRQCWPEGLATFTQSDRHTDRDLDRIIKVIELVEAEVNATWETPDPTKPPRPRRPSSTASDGPAPSLTSPTPATNSPPTFSPTNQALSSSPPGEHEPNSSDSSSNSEVDQWTTTPAPTSNTNSTPPTRSSGNANSSSPTITTQPYSTPPGRPANTSTKSSFDSAVDEGPPADPAAVATLQTKYAALDPDARTWLAGIARQAQQTGRPLHLGDNPTVRRFELVAGLVTLVEGGCADDEVIRGLVSTTVSDPLVTPPALWDLDAGEAAQFAHLCRRLVNGDLVANIADDGQLTFV